MKTKLHDSVYLIASRPKTALGHATLLCVVGGLLALLVHRISLGVFVPAMGWTFLCGLLAAAALMGVVVLIAMSIRLPGSPFSLSPGLSSRGVAELHLPLASQRALRLKDLVRELAATVQQLETKGITKVQLCSILLGDDRLKHGVMTRLNAEFARTGLAWHAVDAGTKKSWFHDAVYWMTFVVIPCLMDKLGVKHRLPIDMKRFKRGTDLGMTWGKLVFKKR